jgi:hypothetical protein
VPVDEDEAENMTDKHVHLVPYSAGVVEWFAALLRPVVCAKTSFVQASFVQILVQRHPAFMWAVIERALQFGAAVDVSVQRAAADCLAGRLVPADDDAHVQGGQGRQPRCRRASLA